MTYLARARATRAADPKDAGERRPGHDPRPDLTVDADLWVTLLGRAHAIDGYDGDGLYWTLLGARAVGVELYAAAGTWRLRPRPDTEADYLALKLNLNRNLAALRALLRDASERE